MIVQELVATLGLEVNEQAFDRGLLALKGLTMGLAGIGAAVGTAVVGIGAVVKGTAEVGAEVQNLSTTANVGAGFFQTLAYAAGEVGFEMDDLRDVFLDLSERAHSAADGAEEYTKVFKNLGIEVGGALKKMDGETLLRKVADGFAKMPEGTLRAATASELLGETGARLLPILLKGSKGLDEYGEKARRAGAVLSGDTLAASVKFKAETVALEASLAGLRNEVGSGLMPIFTDATIALTDFIRENRHLIATPVVKFMRGLATAFAWTKEHLDELKGATALWVGFLMARYLMTLSTITAAELAWGSAALIAGARAAASWALATAGAWLALAPLAAVIAAVILLADELYEFANGGDTLLGRWIKWLDSTTEPDGALGKMLELFKATGSLIFDLTDPNKWVRMGKALYDVVLMPLELVMDVLRGIGGFVSNAFQNSTFTGFQVGGKEDKRKATRVGDVTGRDVTPFFIEDAWVGSGGQGATLGDRWFGADRYASKAPGVPLADANAKPGLFGTSPDYLFGSYSASPAASVANSPSTPTPAPSSTYSPTVSAQVTVTVGDNVNPRQTGDAVAQAISGEWWSAPDNAANLVAVDQ